MRKIIDIYNEYRIMPHLQMHQLSVAAVAKQICESLDISLNAKEIIITCLLHDMGNVIKFDMAQTKSVFGLSDLEIEEAKEIKKEYISKYGGNEHEATVKILQELNLPDNIVEFANQNRFSMLCDHAYGKDLALKIIHYSDMRVGPHGVISYEERMNEAGKRYKNHPQSIEEIERLKLVECGRDIEKQIFAHSNIKPEDISDESVAETIEELKSFEI